MGGNALNNIVRMNKDEYHSTMNIVKLILDTQNIKYSFIKCYNSKETFGDLDVVIEKTTNTTENRNFIIKHFNPIEIYKNSDCLSFNLNNFQIDFIYVTPDFFDTTVNYFSYNDLGNLIGRYAQSLSMKYGQKGLYYKITRQDYTKDVIISKNMEDIYNFLGLDYDKFLIGFDTIQEIFDFVINSKYFNSKFFKPFFWDSEDRRRNKKRKHIMLFFDYIKDIPEKEYSIDKEHIPMLIFENFPESKIFEEIYTAELYIKNRQIIKEKFNGDIIRDIFKLEGKEIGDSILKFKHHLKSEYDYFLLLNTQDVILELFKKINKLTILK